MRKTKRYLEFVMHLVTISALLYKGVDEVRKGLYYPGSIILGLAVIAMIVTLFWRQFKIQPRIARQTSYYLEAAGLFLSGYVFYLEHHHGYSQACIIAGFAYCAIGFLSTRIKFG
ncbi:MAG: hypothetical protein EOP54_24575 [Sphingobacteriales bacterium]|nr:MAG: hypothetical protein EOP54_24575 [Sphingobacteriales bacterium]